MMDWLATNGGTLVLVVFFAMFLGFAFWAFVPGNKQRMDEYGKIPLKEIDDGE
jgi:cbb3-type cytochrome oxidase subunit 3